MREIRTDRNGKIVKALEKLKVARFNQLQKEAELSPGALNRGLTSLVRDGEVLRKDKFYALTKFKEELLDKAQKHESKDEHYIGREKTARAIRDLTVSLLRSPTVEEIIAEIGESREDQQARNSVYRLGYKSGWKPPPPQLRLYVERWLEEFPFVEPYLPKFYSPSRIAIQAGSTPPLVKGESELPIEKSNSWATLRRHLHPKIFDEWNRFKAAWKRLAKKHNDLALKIKRDIEKRLGLDRAPLSGDVGATVIVDLWDRLFRANLDWHIGRRRQCSVDYHVEGALIFRCGKGRFKEGQFDEPIRSLADGIKADEYEEATQNILELTKKLREAGEHLMAKLKTVVSTMDGDVIYFRVRQ